MQRASGILLPIFSLPSKYGIGSLGREAYRFVDFLADIHQAYWQVLPLGPTCPDSGNSPYSALSSFAGDPNYIDLDLLQEEGLLESEDLTGLEWGKDPGRIDYLAVDRGRDRVLHQAFARFRNRPLPEDYSDFLDRTRHWLEDYALYRVLRSLYGRDWTGWPREVKKREREALEAIRQAHGEEVDYQVFLQYTFFNHYDRLSAYAHEKGIRLIGDLPIYTPMDSGDAWARARYFLLDEDKVPVRVSGVPPDAYSADGQVWNHPLYRWDVLKDDGYSYWLDKMGANARLFDLVRLDHFIGFTTYFSIPYGEKTAHRGEWVEGPGLDFFRTIQKAYPDLPLIAEDLGSLTPAVSRIKDAMAYPGMGVLQFAFGGDDSKYLPHNFVKNSVVYTSTHDSAPFLGWYRSLPDPVKKRVEAYLLLSEEEGIHWGAIRSLLGSVSDLTIFSLQDLLGLGEEGRINIPGIAEGNWVWRVGPDYDSGEVRDRMRAYMTTYRRYPF
ncbi:MAG: 4-alpha-glucanotransferase [Firmicutes bacterium]|nr:4-alpha-glucanotransferase [Bacillota bacterium]